MANSFEELPIVQRVGDLIRVHRATVADYLGAKQLTARVYFNSSWTLFGLEGAPRHEFVPFRYLGKSYSEVTKAEQRALRELRRWAAKHLKETYQGGKKVITLKELGLYHEQGRAKYEVDLVVRVEKMLREGEKTSEISVKDLSGEQVWTAKVSTYKYRWLREKQIVIIKHASLYDTEKDSHQFIVKSASNILAYPDYSRLAKLYNI
jgi:hypothetical protein